MKRITVGGWVSIIGGLFVLLSLFLPIASSDLYADIAENSLIQKTEGIVTLILLAGTGGLIARSETAQRWTSSIGVVVAGVLLTGWSAILLFSTSLRTLSPAGQPADNDLYGQLDYIAATETASPGAGLILGAVGSLAVLIGAIMTVHQLKKLNDPGAPTA